VALPTPIEIRNSGHVGGYWRLIHDQADMAAGRVEFQRHGYPDQEARVAGKQALPVIRFRATAQQLGLEDLHQLSTASLYDPACVLPAEDGAQWFVEAHAA
jgi:hypothetical protein